jgi:hypothetical protein
MAKTLRHRPASDRAAASVPALQIFSVTERKGLAFLVREQVWWVRKKQPS